MEYTKEELHEALQVVSSTIGKCEKIQAKFTVGTAQHTLLKNRLKAMYISSALIMAEDSINEYTKEDLLAALSPISSIISKCEKAQLKFAKDSPNYNRFELIIKSMYISKSLLTNEINRRG